MCDQRREGLWLIWCAPRRGLNDPFRSYQRSSVMSHPWSMSYAQVFFVPFG